MPPPKKPNAWSVDEKIKILAGAATLTGEQLSGFLEQHGVHLAELDQWRLALDEEGRGQPGPPSRSSLASSGAVGR